MWLEQRPKLATASYIDINMHQQYKMKYCKRIFFTYDCIHICMDDNCINHDWCWVHFLSFYKRKCSCRDGEGTATIISFRAGFPVQNTQSKKETTYVFLSKIHTRTIWKSTVGSTCEGFFFSFFDKKKKQFGKPHVGHGFPQYSYATSKYRQIWMVSLFRYPFY